MRWSLKEPFGRVDIGFAAALSVVCLVRAWSLWSVRPAFPQGPDLELWVDAVYAFRSFSPSMLGASGRPPVYPLLTSLTPLGITDAGPAVSLLAWTFLPVMAWLGAARMAASRDASGKLVPARLAALLPALILAVSMRLGEPALYLNSQLSLNFVMVAVVCFGPLLLERPPARFGRTAKERAERAGIVYVALAAGLPLVKEQGLVVGAAATLWAVPRVPRRSLAIGLALAAVPQIGMVGLEILSTGGRQPKILVPFFDVWAQLTGGQQVGGGTDVSGQDTADQFSRNLATYTTALKGHEWIVALAALSPISLLRPEARGRWALWGMCTAVLGAVTMVVPFLPYHVTTALTLLTLGTVWLPAWLLASARPRVAYASVAAFAGIFGVWGVPWARTQDVARQKYVESAPNQAMGTLLAQAIEAAKKLPPGTRMAASQPAVARLAGLEPLELHYAKVLGCGDVIFWQYPLPAWFDPNVADQLASDPVIWQGAALPNAPMMRISAAPCGQQQGGAQGAGFQQQQGGYAQQGGGYPQQQQGRFQQGGGYPQQQGGYAAQGGSQQQQAWPSGPNRGR